MKQEPSAERGQDLATAADPTAASDEVWMAQALALARQAESDGEVPVGAVVVLDNQVIGRGWNRPVGDCDATGHAEINAIRDACRTVGNYRLPGACLYVTLEPCAMCAGAIGHARIERVVYGADDFRAGAVHSIFAVFDEPRLNHRVAHRGGVGAEESAALLRAFFRARRSR
ncbi:tRNA adenosine(34) deaminase TadA [Salinisphaera aquimarina]|uniref:tRNA-specific adenosine deaminase n=1 Tax=Salinisphaera aquimarina TaxID=2094031 RepID=A0ABV7ETE7_9GAMM